MGRKDNLIIEDAKIIFRNFEGREGDYNREGDRNFSVVIEDQDLADTLIRDGWNLKPLKKHDPDDETVYHLKVTVNMGGNWPAKAFIVNRRGIPNRLDEDTVRRLDTAELDKVDIVINPSNWEVNGKTGVKAYLKDIYASLVEDELARKYSRGYDDGEPMEAFRYRR